MNEDVTDYRKTASNWHAGQWSALYQYMSTGVADQHHKDCILDEIRSCMSIVGAGEEVFDCDELLRLEMLFIEIDTTKV